MAIKQVRNKKIIQLGDLPKGDGMETLSKNSKLPQAAPHWYVLEKKAPDWERCWGNCSRAFIGAFVDFLLTVLPALAGIQANSAEPICATG